MRKARTKCPEAFTAACAVECLRSSLADGALERCKRGGSLFEYDWTLKKPDKKALYHNRALIKSLLLENSTAVFKKSVLQEAFEEFNACDGTDHCLTKEKPPNYLSDQVYTLVQLFTDLKQTRKNTSSGARQPPWLVELFDLM
eukprot:7778210-Lingulodinium_polyedra.AAC.1